MILNFLFKSTDILGYAMDGYILCPACHARRESMKKSGLVPTFDETGHPIIVDEYCANVEPGTVEPCDQCGADIYEDMEDDQ